MAEGAEVSPFVARTTLRWLKPFHARSIKLKVIFKPWYLDPQGLPDEGKVSKVVIGAVWLVLAFWSWAPSCILEVSSTGSELARLCRVTWGLVLRAIYKTQLVTRVFFSKYGEYQNGCPQLDSVAYFANS
jgi:hypothetical protein